MARHDLKCVDCGTIHKDTTFHPKFIVSLGYVFFNDLSFECEKCECNGFNISWDSGEAPRGLMKEERIGDLWKNIDPSSAKFRKANREAIERDRKKNNGKL